MFFHDSFSLARIVHQDIIFYVTDRYIIFILLLSYNVILNYLFISIY